MQNSNTFRRHTNTSCCRTQIHFTGTDKYSIHAPRQLCLLQRNWNSCLRLSVFFIKLVSRFLFEPLDAMQKFKLDLSKDFAQDDKMPHFGRFCGVCSARVCFCLPYVARGARSGLVWRSPPYGELQKFTSGDICDRLCPTLPEGSFPEISNSIKDLSKMLTQNSM